jgi:HEAT repeat protein
MESKLWTALPLAGPLVGLAFGVAAVRDAIGQSPMQRVVEIQRGDSQQAQNNPFAVQQGQPGNASSTELTKELEKAKLLRRMGNDLPRAANLLRGVAQNPKTSAELRSTALYNLALCLSAMKQEKAANEALQQAAAGQGADANKAKQLLQGSGAVNESALAQSVHRAIDGHLRGDSNARKDLEWLGRAAVPQLVDATQTYRYDRDKMRRIVEMILRLGGTEAESFLSDVAKSEDLLFRRAVAQGLYSRNVDPKLIAEMRKFLDDSDAAIRAEALGALVSTFSDEELLNKMQSARTLQEYGEAMQWLVNRTPTLPLPQARQMARRLSESILERWSSATERDRNTLLMLSKQMSFLSHAFYSVPGRRLILSQVEHPHGIRVPSQDWFSTDVEKGLPIEQILSAAKKMGPQSTESVRRDRRQEMILALALAERGRPKTELLPLVLELAKLNYDYVARRSMEQPALDEWLLDLATPDHLPRVAELLLSFQDPKRTLGLMSRREGFDACTPALLEITEQLAEAEKRGSLDKRRKNVLRDLPRYLLLSGDRNALQPLLVMAKQGKISRDRLVDGLLSWKDEEANNTLAELVLEPKLGSNSRSEALIALLEADPDRYATLLPKSVPLGFRSRSTKDGERKKLFMQGGPFIHLWVSDAERSDLWIPAIAEERLVEIFDAIAGMIEEDAPKESRLSITNDLSALLTNYPNRQVRIPDGMLNRLARMLPKLTDAGALDQLRNTILNHLRNYEDRIPESYAEGVRQMIESPAIEMKSAGLYHARRGALAERVLPQVLACFRHENRQIWNTAYSSAAESGEDAAFEALRKELSSPDPQRRSAALSELTQHFRDRAPALVVPLLEDEDRSVRLTATKSAGTLFIKQAVPQLLRLMSDSSSGIRKAAKESLDKIRYYHEQVAHWQKWLDGTGTGASTPAEALIQQAQKGKTKEIRLLAIRSLGTLADPTTLPFLISLLENEDAELATAARKAVETAHRLIEQK